MNENKKYINFCKVCKRETIQIISQARRNKGCRLICLICNKESPKWHNFKLLKEYDFDLEYEKAQRELDSENNQLNKGESAQKEPIKP